MIVFLIKSSPLQFTLPGWVLLLIRDLKTFATAKNCKLPTTYAYAYGISNDFECTERLPFLNTITLFTTHPTLLLVVFVSIKSRSSRILLAVLMNITAEKLF